MLVTPEGFLKCSRCEQKDLPDVIQHNDNCPLIYYSLWFGACSFGHPLFFRGIPSFASFRAAKESFDLAVWLLRSQKNSWTKTPRRIEQVAAINAVVRILPLSNPFVAEQALLKTAGDVNEAKQWAKLWLQPEFQAIEHNALVGVCIALSPVGLSPYVVNWIVSWLLEFAYKSDLVKIRLIERVQVCCASARAARLVPNKMLIK